MRWRIAPWAVHNRFMVPTSFDAVEPSREVPGADEPAARSHGAAAGTALRGAKAEGPALTVAAVARRLGVAPATLRTWDRRYGLGPSQHMAGSHRRYSSTDVGRLLVMRRLTLEGVAPSEAARTALSSAAASSASTVRVPSVTEVLDAYTDAVSMAADPAALVAAAAHFDNAAVRWMLARVHPRDVLAWWSDLVAPSLRALAERSVLERPGESVVPALESAAFAELRSRAAVAVARSQRANGSAGSPRDTGADQVPSVLAIAAGVRPDLLLHVIATALQARGVPVRVLSGGSVAAVGPAVERMRPSVALVHEASAPGDADRAAHAVSAVVAVDRSVPVFVHRQGSAPFVVPSSATVHHVRTLTGALHEILAVLG